MDKEEKQQMLLCVAHSGGVGGRASGGRKYFVSTHTHSNLKKREKRLPLICRHTHIHTFMCALHARTPRAEKRKEERRGAASAGDVENQVVL